MWEEGQLPKAMVLLTSELALAQEIATFSSNCHSSVMVFLQPGFHLTAHHH